MNSLIETLNHLGAQFLSFAWPMLWQSSLLIGMVLAAEVLLAGRLRASIRHALWLVVLVKLLLPPTLALPTGAAWWLFPAPPAIKAVPPKQFMVSYDTDMQLPFVPRTRATNSLPPPPKLDGAGWALLATGVVSAGLFLWLLFRWAQAVRLANRAHAAGELAGPLAEAQRMARLRRSIRVRLVGDRMSPAVCGLFRPTILLPRMLAEKLSAGQLRAVLLHEIMHLRRLDIWVNCAQALLQVAYWWHPLVWLANARIRRVREEAVDDAVMLALAGEGDIYAPTLLEVAKLAFKRPLMSLGLVGIMESRSALRQRVERLLAFRPPRRAGLSLVSLLAILAFSAVALPMGQAPAPEADAPQSAPAVAEATPVKPSPLHVSVLIQARIYQMTKETLSGYIADLPFHPGTDAGVAWWLASPGQYLQITNKLDQSGLTPTLLPRILTFSGMPAEFWVGDDVGQTEIDCLPVADHGQLNLTVTGDIVEKLANGAVTNHFEAKPRLQDHGGLVFRTKDDASNAVVFLMVEIITNKPPAHFQPRPQSSPKAAPEKDAEKAATLIQDGKLLYEMNKLAEAATHFETALALDPENATAKYYLGIIDGTRKPVLQASSPGRKQTIEKLSQIRLASVHFQDLPLREAVRRLAEQAQSADPEKTGITFRMPPDPSAEIDFITGLPAAGSGTSNLPDAGSVSITINPGLSNVTLEDALDAVVKGAASPIQYGILADGSVFFESGAESTYLLARTFKINQSIFWDNLRQQTGVTRDPESTNLATADYTALRNLIGAAGVDWKSPPGKSLFCKPGMIYSKATGPDLEAIEKLIVRLNQPAWSNAAPPKLNQKADPSSRETTADVQTDAGAATTQPAASNELVTLTFQVAPAPFLQAIQSANLQPDSKTDGAETSVATIKQFFNHLGVNWDSPAGKTLFYNDKNGLIFARATQNDLDTIEHALEAIHQPAPQIHVKARFISVPDQGFDLTFPKLPDSTNLAPGGFTGIISSKNLKSLLQTLSSRKGVETLGEPEITTTSGRQTQMRATDIITVVTNFAYALISNSVAAVIPQTESVQVGPILDCVPKVLADGYMINLNTSATVIEMLGYGKPPTKALERTFTRPATNATGQVFPLPLVCPVFQVRQQPAKVNLWDGQTLVLLLDEAERNHYTEPKLEAAAAKLVQDDVKKNGKKRLVVLVTANLVDPAGNLIHSYDEMPFSTDAIPPQN